MKTILNVESLESKQMLSATTYTTDDVEVFADGERPTPSDVTVNEWAYTNTEGKKINWYIYGQDLTDNKLDTLGRLKTMNVKFSEFNSAGVGLYFTIYTAPQNDGLDASSWYRSRVNFTGDYTYTADHNIDVDVTKAVGDARKEMDNWGKPKNYKVGLNVDPWSSRGPMGDGEILSYIALSTSSGQPAGTEDWAIKSAKVTFQGRPNHSYNFVTLGDEDPNISEDPNFDIVNVDLLNYQVNVSEMSPIILAGYDSFVVTYVYGPNYGQGSLFAWDTVTEEWRDVSTPPTTGNPAELLELLQLRLVDADDILYWKAPSDATGDTPVFDYVGWNSTTYASTPTETVFAQL